MHISTNHRAGGKTQLNKKLRAGPQTFQEWPSFKQEYARYTGVLFGLKVTPKA